MTMISYKHQVLIVDDEQGILITLKKDIERLATQLELDFEIHTASNTKDAFRIMRRLPITIFFLDYQLKNDMSGDELIARIDDEFGQKFVVLMSAVPTEEIEEIVDKHTLKRRTSFDFLHKPFNEFELKAALRRIRSFILDKPWPFPLAHARYSPQTRESAHAKFWQLGDSVKTLTKFLSILLIADHPNFTTPKWFAKIDNPQLKDWLNLLEHFVACYDDSMDLFVPYILPYFQENREAFEALNNELFSNGNMLRSENWYRQKLDRIEEQVDELFDNATFLKEFILLCIEGLNINDRDMSNNRHYKARLLMNFEASFQMVHFKTKSSLDLTSRNVYIYHDNTALSLKPYMMYEICKECELERLYVLNNLNPKKPSYYSICPHNHDMLSSIDISDHIKLEREAPKLPDTDQLILEETMAIGITELGIAFLIKVGNFAMDELKERWKLSRKNASMSVAEKEDDGEVKTKDSEEVKEEAGQLLQEILTTHDETTVKRKIELVEGELELIHDWQLDLQGLEREYSRQRIREAAYRRDKSELEDKITKHRQNVVDHLKNLGIEVESI